jgi:hypothetical protein
VTIAPCSYLNVQPYPGFNPDELHEYVFVPLPTLQRRFIHRQLTGFEGEDQGVSTYKRPFLDFPTLKHRAHPFYVIHNALPNLREHCGELDHDQMKLYALIIEIDARWRSRQASTSLGPGKRRRLPDSDDEDTPKHMTRAAAKRFKSKRRRLLDAADDDDDDAPKHMTRATTKHLKSKLSGAEACQIRGKRNSSKGKDRPKGLGNMPRAQPQESRYQSYTPSTDDGIAAWAAAVAAAGTPEVRDETVFWSEEAPVRAPIKRWDKWHHSPYKLPKQRSRYCSYDWPLYFYSYSLWVPHHGK